MSIFIIWQKWYNYTKKIFFEKAKKFFKNVRGFTKKYGLYIEGQISKKIKQKKKGNDYEKRSQTLIRFNGALYAP